MWPFLFYRTISSGRFRTGYPVGRATDRFPRVTSSYIRRTVTCGGDEESLWECEGFELTFDSYCPQPPVYLTCMSSSVPFNTNNL